MAKIYLDANILPPGPQPARSFNGWQLRTTNYQRFARKIAAGAYETSLTPQGFTFRSAETGWTCSLLFDRQGRLLSSLGRPIILPAKLGQPGSREVGCRDFGDHTVLNVFYWALGLNGDLVSGREIVGEQDKDRMFSAFIDQAQEHDGIFTQAVWVRTDQYGRATFNYNGKAIPCVLARGKTRGPELINKRLLLVPVRVDNALVWYVFSGKGKPCIGEVDFFLDKMLFGYEDKCRTIFYAELKQGEGFLVTEALGYSMRAYEWRGRTQGCVLRLILENERLTRVATIDWNKVDWAVVNPMADPPVLQLGFVPIAESETIGKKTEVNLSFENKSQRFYVVLAQSVKIPIPTKTVKMFEWQVNDKLEVELFDGQIISLLGKEKRLPFKIVWHWQDNGYQIDNTTVTRVKQIEAAGCYVFEHLCSWTGNYDTCAHEHVKIGGLTEKLCPPMREEVAPLYMSVVAANGEVLYLEAKIEGPSRLSDKGWKVARAVGSAIQPGAEIARKPRLAAAKAREGRKILEQADIKTINLNLLKKAHDIYIEAYLSDPTRLDYLRSAKVLQKHLIARIRKPLPEDAATAPSMTPIGAIMAELARIDHGAKIGHGLKATKIFEQRQAAAKKQEESQRARVARQMVEEAKQAIARADSVDIMVALSKDNRIRHRKALRRMLNGWFELPTDGTGSREACLAHLMIDYFGGDEFADIGEVVTAFYALCRFGAGDGGEKISAELEAISTEVFESLPLVLDLSRAVGDRLLTALKIASGYERLNSPVSWILNNPPEGKEELFAARREAFLPCN